jgi:flagellar hook-basal body complex protein FliE
MSTLTGPNKVLEQLLSRAREIQDDARKMGGVQSQGPESGQSGGASFADHLRESVRDVNGMSKTADRMGMELSTGKTGNIHDTMLAATQAELSFNLMVQLRNKALEAYSEVMRMPV